jgi:hypothetical protein
MLARCMTVNRYPASGLSVGMRIDLDIPAGLGIQVADTPDREAPNRV